MEIAEFLLARVAEDETSALAYGSTGPSRHLRGQVPEPYGDPTRVLAECEAKRRIITEGDKWFDGADENYRVLRLLAQPYRDHPDFDPAWRGE